MKCSLFFVFLFELIQSATCTVLGYLQGSPFPWLGSHALQDKCSFFLKRSCTHVRGVKNCIEPFPERPKDSQVFPLIAANPFVKSCTSVTLNPINPSIVIALTNFCYKSHTKLGEVHFYKWNRYLTVLSTVQYCASVSKSSSMSAYWHSLYPTQAVAFKAVKIFFQ